MFRRWHSRSQPRSPSPNAGRAGARALVGAGALLQLAPLALAQVPSFAPPSAWDVISLGPVDRIPQEGDGFGKAALLRTTPASIADVVVRRGAVCHLLLEPGSYKQALEVPVTGLLRDVAVLPGVGTPDALAVATSTGVEFLRRAGTGFEVESFLTGLPVERVAAARHPGAAGDAAFALWAPTVGRVQLFGLHWNPATDETEVAVYPPRQLGRGKPLGAAATKYPLVPASSGAGSLDELQGLAVLDFDGDSTPDVALAQAGVLRVFSFTGHPQKIVRRTGSTRALVPFAIPGTDREGLAWLRTTSAGSTLEAVGLGNLGPPVTSSAQWFGVTAMASSLLGGSGPGPMLVVSDPDDVRVVRLHEPGNVLGAPESLQPHVGTDGWALIDQIDRDACDELVDLLTFDDVQVAARLHRGETSQNPSAAISLQAAVLAPLQTDDFVSVSFRLAAKPELAGEELRLRVWRWQDLCVPEAGSLMIAEASTTIGANPILVPMTLPNPEPFADAFVLEVRVLGSNETHKVLDVVWVRSEDCRPNPPIDCQEKTGEPLGLIPIPGKPIGPRQP